MNCAKFKDLISPYIDDEITPEEQTAFEQHLKECADCARNYEGIRRTIELCHGLVSANPPEHLSKMVLKKISSDKKQRSKRSAQWKALTGLAAVLIVAVMITRLVDWVPKFNMLGFRTASEKAAPQTMMDTAQPYKMESLENQAKAPSLNSETAPQEQADMIALPSESEKATMFGAMEARGGQGSEKMREISKERKLIKTARINISVEDFDGIFDSIVKLAEESGGFVQTSGVYNNTGKTEMQRNGHLTLRVPYNRFADIIEKIQEMGELNDKVISGDDITMQYYDTEARLTAYQKQEQRLIEILDKAKTVDDILRVENELSRIRYEIEALNGQIKTWDSLVGFSTIEVAIKENRPSRKIIESSGFSGIWAKSVSGFITTLNKLINMSATMVVAIITALPVFVILLIFGLIFIKIYHRRLARRS